MSKAKAFTDNYLRSLKPEASRYEVTAAGRRGLMCRVHPSGEKSFVVRYKFAGRAQPVLTLGRYPEPVSLADAFERHKQVRDFLDKGIDPREGLDADRREHEAAKQREAVAAAGRRSYRDRYNEFFEMISKSRKRPEEITNKLGRNTLDKWGDRRAESITKADAVELLQGIVDRDAPAMANDVQEQLVQFFRWMAGRDYIPANPMTFAEMIGGEEYSRERWLSDDELCAFFGAMRTPEHGISRRIRLALLLPLVTAQRPGEVRAMRWDELDLDQGVWTIPGDVVEKRRSEKSGRKRNVKVWGKTKNGAEHVIPLSPLALAILDALRADVVEQFDEPQPYVVAAFAEKNRGEPVEEKALARALRNCIDEPGTPHEKLFGCEPYTPHDLRRTATTLLGSLKIPPHIQSRVINHVADDERANGDKSLATYDRWQYLDEKRLALNKLSARVLSVTGFKSPQAFVATVADRKRPEQKGKAKPRKAA